eukprot:g45202.t1
MIPEQNVGSTQQGRPGINGLKGEKGELGDFSGGFGYRGHPVHRDLPDHLVYQRLPLVITYSGEQLKDSPEYLDHQVLKETVVAQGMQVPQERKGILVTPGLLAHQ